MRIRYLLSTASKWLTITRTIATTVEHCQGYSVAHITESPHGIQADLDIIGEGCSLYDQDIRSLKLTVECQTDSRLHIAISDRDESRYQVPEDVFPRPKAASAATCQQSRLSFRHTNSPFSFQVLRSSTEEVLFDTLNTPLVFETRFLRLKTWLPKEPNIYGLGEHIDPFRLYTKGYIRTFWARDSDGVPYRENLYGAHPVYFEHRITGTHGVLLLNSNGIDVNIDEDETGQPYMEFIAIGGVLDFYFFAGPSPVEVSRQYAQVAGLPAMVPYWSLGFHQCRFGYRDWFEVAEVITNYSAAEIPLEQAIRVQGLYDQMLILQERCGQTLTTSTAIVKYLHEHQQQYMLMVDPAIADSDYPAYLRGAEMDIFLKTADGSPFRGVVWPGVTVYPDWYHANTTLYWIERFQTAFNAAMGVDIDGVWIDMNEPANMCSFPCEDPWAEAKKLGLPPDPPRLREPPRPLPGFPTLNAALPSFSDDSTPTAIPCNASRSDSMKGPFQTSSGRTGESRPRKDVLFPAYKIHNGGPTGSLSDLTVHTDVRHANGLLEYDIHNLYGTMMSIATRTAMLERRPGLRPFIVSRSTFAGAGRYVAKWLGDNAARWDHYRSSIAGLLAFASIFQIPMVGSDVCGFKLNATEQICARWATLGAFSPFFRNHNHEDSSPQEFYRWPLVTAAAKYAISVRYRLLDYIYTALYAQSLDGTPAINPLWFLYPQDPHTFDIDLQYFYGDCILVSPVTEENATEVTVYFPDDLFYEFDTFEPIRGRGDFRRISGVPFDRIPLHIRGGCVLPLRVESANTTTELRKKNFELIIAPGLDGTATGSLFVDDGVTLEGGPRLWLRFEYEAGK